MSRARKAIAAVLGATAWWLVSCRELPAPEGGILSISPLLLPSPGLVAGDTMRDSLGFAAPLRVIAYSASGDTLSGVTATFITLDAGAHLEQGGPLLVGDEVGKTVRIVGSLAALQTKPESVKVTLSPDTLVAADSILHHMTYTLVGGDTVVNTGDLTTIVQHVGATTSGVPAVIVRYVIDKAPAGDPAKGPTLLLMSRTIQSSRDTTDANGRAARSARLRLAPLAAFEADTALVSATASYRGRTIGVVQFTLVFTSNP
jgi:hypothetical protein